MKIAIGADSFGYPLKISVVDYLAEVGHELDDLGVHAAEDQTPYYITANRVATRVTNQEVDRAVLICGTGMGMSIIANKHPGVYAAVCETTFAAEKSRSINNSNVLTLGAMVTTETLAKEILEVWLRTEFTQGWDENIQEWLQQSMVDISLIEVTQFPEGSEK